MSDLGAGGLWSSGFMEYNRRGWTWIRVTDMRDTCGRYEVVALHLDYANRAESGREADFVEAWCRQMGIIFRKRVVGEVTRGVTARDEYEKVSREIRFAFYQEVRSSVGSISFVGVTRS